MIYSAESGVFVNTELLCFESMHYKASDLILQCWEQGRNFKTRLALVYHPYHDATALF